jgi:hypothetical protein
VEDDPVSALYEITFWDQFKTYALVRKGETVDVSEPA